MKGIRFVHSKVLAQIPDYSRLSERSLQRRMAAIRDFADKSPGQPVIVDDVARYLGCSPEQIENLLFSR